MEPSRIEKIRFTLKPLRVRLFGHEIYQQMETLDDIREFMEHHVFAVWDNMSQLKALQIELSTIDHAWVPSPYKNSIRIFNEMALEDECDKYNGENMSHFELYKKAMEQAGAKTHLVDRFLILLQEEGSMHAALDKIQLPDSIKKYLKINWEISHSGQPHAMAAAFFLGREDVVPQLFHKLADDLILHHPKELSVMKEYLERHTNVDTEKHNEHVEIVLQELCGEDEQKWKEAEAAAKSALEARFALWDGMLLLSV
ncbi:DUF3050 domain-containing protein [Nafulsella turpanensis]|uniref:DUF3050 domain-containing protein n=1 Tax=Nafulsella turpanensis TaxID=1265690 RepID=UPI00034AA8F7|nr:DUF3050 domain-containing protein [Nafulsella turpanensis]